MIGTIVLAAFLSFRQPTWLEITSVPNGLPSSWLKVGQLLLAVELGRNINLSVLQTFSQNWLTITIMLLLSIIFSLISGVILWKFSQSDMLTSFFATAPGGVATMPGIAEEVGANTAVVSIIQTMRIFLVVLTIPFIASSWLATPVDQILLPIFLPLLSPFEFEWVQLIGTLVLVLSAWGGSLCREILEISSTIACWGHGLCRDRAKSYFNSIGTRSIGMVA